MFGRDTLRRIRTLAAIAAITGLTASVGRAQLDGTPDNDKERAPAKEGVEPVIKLDTSDPTDGRD